MKRRGIYLVGILLLLAILIVSCTKIVSKVEEGKSEQYKGISLDKTVNFKEVTYQVSSEWYASEDDEYSNFYCLDIEEPLVSILLCCEKDTQTDMRSV